MDEQLEYLDKYLAGINPKKLYSKSLLMTNKQYLKNILYLRGIFLVKLFNYNRKGFFDSPKLENLLLTVFKPPVRPFFKFSAIFSQFFMKTLCEIQNTPDDFIDTVIGVFKTDISQLIPFAYSTFPTIFSYFSTQEFVYLGNNFLIQFIKKSPSIDIVSELINAYFTACTVFYEKLWNILSDHLSNRIIDYSTEFREIFSSSLKVASQELTKQHCDVLIAFITKYSVEAVSFIFLRLFKEPFDEISFSSYLFHDQENVDAFSEYLYSLSKEEKLEEAAFLTSIFYNGQHTIYPSLSDLTDRSAISFIVSENDIKELFNYFKTIKATPPNLKPSFSDSYDPYDFEIFPGLNNSSWNAVSNDSLLQLNFMYNFDGISENIQENDMDNRFWNILVDNSTDQSIPITNSVKKAIEKHPEKKDFLQYKLYMLYQENYSKLYSSIALTTVCKSLNETESSVFFVFSNIMYNLLFDKMNDIMKNDKTGLKIRARLEKSLSTIQLNSLKGKIPMDLLFYFSCCALDTISISPTKVARVIEDSFMKSLYLWVDSNHLMLEVGRYGKLSYLLSDLNLVGFGKRLRKMIEFMKQFESIFGSELNDQWVFYFQSIMYSFPSPYFFSSFLFVNHFILSSNILASYWDVSSKTYWNHLSYGVAGIAKNDSSLLQKINDPMFCASIFNIWGRKNETFV